MAHNLVISKVNIPYYSISDINNMFQIEINNLAKLLKMKGNNVVNIKNILRYLHKLDETINDNLKMINVDITKCDLYANTHMYGNIDSIDDIYTAGPDSLDDLKLEAINRGINISDSLYTICENIKRELPSLDWQKRNILIMSNPNVVSEELKDVNDYGSYPFIRMNNYRRQFPNKKASINQTIERTDPLDKDIVVFRYVKN